MEIRGFETKDEQEVMQLWTECGLTVPWNDPIKDIQRKLKVNPELFLVGTINNKIIASVMGGYDGHRGWINYLAVSPEYQKTGLAKEIMFEIENRIKLKGCPKINLQIRETNQKVIDFYKTVGYKIDPVVSMGKRLVSDK
jgi:ribosomal protein S18 acetylase RimI-like enzyme